MAEVMLTRRDFLKLVGATAVVTGVYLAVRKEMYLFSQVFEQSSGASGIPSDVVAFTTCYGCLGRCNVEVIISGQTKLPRFIAGSIFTMNEGATCGIGASAMLHYLSP
ncbi:MAG: twin-arginine translocation signal domain-containing protein, partial [Caldivirga sp.]